MIFSRWFVGFYYGWYLCYTIHQGDGKAFDRTAKELASLIGK